VSTTVDVANDPFAPENDPYPPAPPRRRPLPVANARTLGRLSRREVGRLALLGAGACALPLGCATTRARSALQPLACDTPPDDVFHCIHPFCRHHRPAAVAPPTP
jgi:hypothetical protein